MVIFDDYIAYPDDPARSTQRMTMADGCRMYRLADGLHVERNGTGCFVPIHMVRQWWVVKCA